MHIQEEDYHSQWIYQNVSYDFTLILQLDYKSLMAETVSSTFLESPVVPDTNLGG